MHHKFRNAVKMAILGILLVTLLVSLSSVTRAETTFFVYLPLILTIDNSFPNGNFESGSTGWILNPAGEQLVVSKAELPEGITPHSGIYAAWLGNHNSSDTQQENSISQEISIPAHASDLSLWLQIQSRNYCNMTNSRVSVFVADQLQWWWPLCRTYNTYTWRNEIIDLGSFSNQKAKITIQVTLDPDDTSRVFLDDFLFTTR